MMRKQGKSDSSVSIAGSMRTLCLVQQKGPLNQRTVANTLGVTLPAAFFHFQKLRNEGLLKTLKKRISSERGRPSELWDIDKVRNFTVGICVVPPFLYMGVSDFGGKVVLSEQHDLSGLDGIKLFCEFIDSFMSKAKRFASNKRGELRFVAVGLPGYLDPVNGVVTRSVNMPMLVGFDAEKHIRDKYGIQCRAHTHYYSYYYGEMLTLPVNTTLSVIDWELGLGHVAGCGRETFNVASQKAGNIRGMQDIGHMRIVPNGRDCICGRKGCLEAYTGGWAVLKRLGRPDIKTLADINIAVEKGDEQVLGELSAAAKIIGESMAWVVEFLGVDRVIVTGPLSQSFEYVKNAFCQGLQKYLTRDEIDSLAPTASVDPINRIISGSCVAGTYMFFYPNYYMRNLGVAHDVEEIIPGGVAYVSLPSN